ncbi:stage IV sporulation protein A [Agathobaculum sp. NTUH-O15-33]|uniref:stage IV sporulation protein A n=1 Tax=Agathobaculum sp. NTUH-O15-33 TaxID=3079302 RepID=UPI0029586A44|nr:stage IV sporulation protein A [Agathobaculum sp. NTUH-O15-33]WNX82988.1 stage IV sporulation protein A [Agathobaculum sp. NTUH-O15-33]
MESNAIYEQISARTGGDIYIGVVGPVRTGKSTFIKRFMETMVLPDMENVYKRERARDELPQSGTGRTIMTAEPKFVPEEAAEIALPDGGGCRVRLVDCVGYLVDGALGSMEDDAPRMVSTPWREAPMTLAEAAELGTHKVIGEHSTIGLVVTTDGTFTEIPRASYEPVEGRVIRELREIGKPFVVLVNSAEPQGEAARFACDSLREQYGVDPIAVDCLALDEAGIADVLQRVLYEFPVQEISFVLPRYVGSLPPSHPVQASIYHAIRSAARPGQCMRDIRAMCGVLAENEYIGRATVDQLALGTGQAQLRFDIPESVFYGIVGEQTGIHIGDAADLIAVLDDFSKVKREYDRIRGALDQVYQTGYGIVMPSVEELSLEPPEIVRQGGRYGVRLKASATSVHLLRANIKAEVNPIVGTEKQSEELVHYLLSEFEEQPEKIWDTNIFGKSLSELVREELSHKLSRMPDDARGKIRETLEKIINESAGGLICIIL